MLLLSRVYTLYFCMFHFCSGMQLYMHQMNGSMNYAIFYYMRLYFTWRATNPQYHLRSIHMIEVNHSIQTDQVLRSIHIVAIDPFWPTDRPGPLVLSDPYDWGRSSALSGLTSWYNSNFVRSFTITKERREIKIYKQE